MEKKRREYRKKIKVSFDEEIITKYKAEEILSEQKVIEQNNTDASFIKINNDPVQNQKGKKRKVAQVKVGENINFKDKEKIKDSKEKRKSAELDNIVTSKTEPEEQEKTTEKKESIRARKREKHAQLLEQRKLKVDLQLQQNALNYLSLWKHDRSEWKFEKLKQIWLQKNLFDTSKIPNDFWETTVNYFNGAKGHSRQEVLEAALKIVDREEQSDQDLDNSELQEQLRRARNIIQILQ
ncbi:uncharacterized protein C7orf50 [Sitophilus oryzae]|uniref:Uncharacterized protein C7orf50 n=1 Tax=Sitophilus oryzae TaxID=7048 RepID=A0A6J2XKN4_SITOR|nr:uncharacterized protein C7orf50 [Sitophilus oryzae]